MYDDVAWLFTYNLFKSLRVSKFKMRRPLDTLSRAKKKKQQIINRNTYGAKWIVSITSLLIIVFLFTPPLQSQTNVLNEKHKKKWNYIKNKRQTQNKKFTERKKLSLKRKWEKNKRYEIGKNNSVKNKKKWCVNFCEQWISRKSYWKMACNKKKRNKNTVFYAFLHMKIIWREEVDDKRKSFASWIPVPVWIDNERWYKLHEVAHYTMKARKGLSRYKKK